MLERTSSFADIDFKEIIVILQTLTELYTIKHNFADNFLPHCRADVVMLITFTFKASLHIST